MKVAFSGAGLRSSHVLTLLKDRLPGTEFVGYYDPQPTFLNVLGNNIPSFNSVEKLLSETQPDLFFVGSPNKFHLEQIAIGLREGVRIFAEKPVVTTREETFELCKLLAEYGADRVMVGLVLRHSQQMVDLRQCINNGHLGNIASIEACEHIAPAHGAFFMRDWRRNSAISGGFMLEKCCHDLDLYNMITQSRPKRVASFGGNRSFLPQHRPKNNLDNEIYQSKQSVWSSNDDPFESDGDIIDAQNAILEFESGATMSFHTNLNVPDEHRRFCIIGANGMAEGDFQRGYLHVTTATKNERVFSRDYTDGSGKPLGHYGADVKMVDDIAKFLTGESASLPVSVVDALEAGLSALAIDEARLSNTIIDLTDDWERFDEYKLR